MHLPLHVCIHAGLTVVQEFDGQNRNYPANATIPIADVGEESTALLCRTDRTDCCHGNQRGKIQQGEWIYPNGDHVDSTGSGDDIYRNRDTSVVRLNRRNGATGPTGRYCCEVPSVADPNASICIILIGISYISRILGTSACAC